MASSGSDDDDTPLISMGGAPSLAVGGGGARRVVALAPRGRGRGRGGRTAGATNMPKCGACGLKASRRGQLNCLNPQCNSDMAHLWQAQTPARAPARASAAVTPQTSRVHMPSSQAASAAHSVNTQLDFGDDEERPFGGDGQFDKKIKAPRVLDALDCVGMGDGTEEGNQLSDLNRTPMACTRTPTESGSVFETSSHMQLFAQKFGIPFTWEDHDADLALVPEARRPPQRHFADQTSEVMLALTAAHPEKSLLDVNNEGVSETALPQFHSDVLSNNMLYGAMGGVQGLSTLSLWCVKLDKTDVPDYMLKAVELIIKASRGQFPDGTSIWPCVPTKSSLIMSNKRTVIGGRYRTKTDLHEMQAKQGFRMVDDLHPKLRDRIAEYRGVERDDVVAPHREYKGVTVASRHKDPTEGYEPIERELFKMHLLQNVHKGQLADGEEANIVSTEIRLLSSFPGCCMFVLLQQMMEAKEMQELKETIHVIWKYNKLSLHTPLSCEDMFSRKDDMNAYKLCCAGCIPLAVHTLAAKEGVRMLDCFPVIDVSSTTQRNLYHTMLDEAAARNEFLFHRVLAAVTEKIITPDFELDVASTDTRGWHVRWKNRGVLMRMIDEAKQNERDEWNELRLPTADLAERISNQSQRWETWLGNQIQDANRVYFLRLGYYPALGGTICRINPNYVPARDDRKRKEEHDGRQWQLPDPRGMSALVRTYLPIRLEPRVRNNMQRFYEDDGLVADLNYLKANLNYHLPNQVLSLFHALEKEAATEMFKKKYDLSTREVSTNELLGRNGRHPMYVHLQNNEKAAALCDKAGVDFKTIRVCLQAHIENMATGDMAQWAQVGDVLRSLKKLGSEHWVGCMQDFIFPICAKDHPLLWPRVSDPRVSPVMLLSGIAVLYNESVWSVINQYMDLNAQSKLCVDLFQYSITGMFLWSKSQAGWGYPTWMTDGGGSYHVLTEKGAVQRTDNKTPGTGADVMKIATEDMCKAFPMHCCGDDIATKHKQGLEMDTKYHESPLQMAKDTGTACERDHAGRVILDSNVHAKLGTVTARTEIGKAVKKEDAGDMLANSENTMGHSGTDRGDLVLWTTHMAGKPLHIVQIAVSSVFIMCGNNLTGAQVPSSLSQTGRAKFVASPAALLRGIIACRRADSVAENRHIKKRKLEFARQLQQQGRAQQVPGVLCDKADICRANRPFCFVKWLARRGFPFLGKGFLTGGQCFPTHSMFAWSTVSHRMQLLTKDVRRLNLADADDWSRSFDGPCKTSILQGLHISRMATAYTIQAVMDPVKDSSGQAPPRVDLPMVYENLVLSYMQLPVDMVSVLTALYVYMNMCVLDCNLMVLSCYLTHSMGLQQHCSLVTIALVVSGFHAGLDATQRVEYDRLCEFLLPVVTTQTGPPGPPSPPFNPYSTLMPRHWLVPTQEMGLLGPGQGQDKKSVEMLERWCSFDSPGLKQQGLHNEIRQQYHHVQSVAPGRSTYMMNTVQYVQTVMSAWVRHKADRAQHSRHGNSREDVSTAQMVAASVFGEQHTRTATAARASLVDFQDNVMFFDKAKAGARFPSNERNKEKDATIRFIPNEETATWWNSTIENAGTLECLLLPFMQMCNASLSMSRHELLSKLLGPYMREHNMTRMVCRDPAWTQSIFANHKMNTKAFAMGIQPHMQATGPNTHPEPNGVDVNLGVDVLAFLLLQGLYAQTVHRTSAGHNSVVHHCNNQTAALGILEIMLHTSVPLSEVPVSGGSCRSRNPDTPRMPVCTGRIMLHDTSPIPLAEHTPAVLNFDARLHTDACIHLYAEHCQENTTLEYCPDAVLRHIVRDAGEWLYVSVRQCASDITHNWMCVGTVITGLRPEAQGDLFPFPVESVAHMAGVVQLLRPAYKSACELYEDNLLELARTMRVHVSSIECNMLQYMLPMSITHCAARDEIPCLAWLEVDGQHEGFMFTLRLHAECASILPVEPTHHHSCEVSRYYALRPLQPLPLEEDLRNYVVKYIDLSTVLRAGLMYHEGMVVLRHPNEVCWGGRGVPLANMMFPVINYPTYVTLQVERQILETVSSAGDTVRVAYVSLNAVVMNMMPCELEDEEKAAWFEQHPDVLASLSEHDDLTVFGVDVALVADPMITTASMSVTRKKQWGPRCKFLLCTTGVVPTRLRYCNSLSELRWCLDGDQADLLDNSTHMICDNCDFRKDEFLQNEFWPVRADMTVRILREDRALCAIREDLVRRLAHAEQLQNESRSRVDTLSTSNRAEDVQLLAQHRAALALRSDVVLDLQARLSQVTVEPEVVTLSLNAASMSEVKVVHKLFEPFQRDSGSLPVTACIEAWDSSQFLQDGHYRVRLPVVSTISTTQFHDFEMDFVSVSRCMWLEGQPLYLDVGPEEYEQIMAVFPGLRVADPRLHEVLTHPEARQTWHQRRTSVQFRCHYVLHHGSRVNQMQHAEAQGDPDYWNASQTKNMLQMGVQLLLPVQTCSAGQFGGTYHDRLENQYMMRARLYVDGEMRVHQYPRAATPGRRVILCDLFEYKDEYKSGPPAVHLIQPGDSAVWNY